MAFATLAALVALSVAFLLVALRSLDRPWIKSRIVKLAHDKVGVDIDYRAARLDILSGASIDGLVVRTPQGFSSAAADLVHVGHLQAEWTPESLLGKARSALRRLSVSDVTVAYIVDEQGRSSFDALSGSSPGAPPSQSTQLSQLGSKFLDKTPPVGELAVDGATLIFVRMQHGAVSDRMELSGIAMRMVATPLDAHQKQWRWQVALGSPAAPLPLTFVRTQEGSQQSARAKFWQTIDATASGVNAALDLGMASQTIVSSISADQWLHAEASVRFDPSRASTEVNLDRVEAGDGSVKLQVSMTVPDAGDLTVRRARGDIDAARLLHWVPSGMVPVAIERAKLRLAVDSLLLGSAPRLSDTGSASIDVDVSGVAVDGSEPVEVSKGQLSLQAQPGQGSAIGLKGSAMVDRLILSLDNKRVTALDLGVDLEGRQEFGGVITGRVGVKVSRLNYEAPGATALFLRNSQLKLQVEGLRVDSRAPLATQGDLIVSADLPSFDARSPVQHVVAEGLGLRTHVTLDGHPPYAAELEAPISRLRVTKGDGRVLLDGPVHVQAQARGVQPDLAYPTKTRGVLRAVMEVDLFRGSLEATKDLDALDFTLIASMPSLKMMRPFISSAWSEEVPWERIAGSLRTSGRLADIAEAEPTIRQTTRVELGHAQFDRVATQNVSLTLASEGTAQKHHADLDLHVQGLTWQGGAASDDHVALAVTVDRRRPSLQFKVVTEGLAATSLTGSASFDAKKKSLTYSFDGQARDLAALSPLVSKMHGFDGFDLEKLDAAVSAHGSVFGVVTGLANDGTVTLAPDYVRTAVVEGTADLTIRNFRWAKGDTAILTPAARWHADMGGAAGRRTIANDLAVDSLHLDLGDRDVDLGGVQDRANVAVTGNLFEPEIELIQTLAIRAIAQTVVPEYPMGDVAFKLLATRTPEGVVRLSEMSLSNGLGGTELTVNGNVELDEGHRTLSLTTSLAQELARLSSIPDRFKGKGRVSIEAAVTSPDLTHYHVRAALKGEDVSVALPRAGIDMVAANGEVPVTVVLEVGDQGVALERSDARSPYSMLRFADQHPLLSRSGYLSIARLKTPYATIAPLVGNLAVEQNVVSLRQFEMGVRGGTITGQCAVDWDGPKSTVELHVRASGVQSSHGEPFDGNIAVAISAGDRTIDGRAEILRIGPRHLLDLLDLQDPLRVDPAMNRIRSALALGYPESLRVVFDHGFASAHLQLGGLARLVSIGELRGIPMGPIVDKMMAPAPAGSDAKESQ